MIRSVSAIHAPAKKETQIHFRTVSGPMIPPKAQNSLMSPAPSIPKINKMTRIRGTVLPAAKNKIPAGPFLQIQAIRPRNMENKIQPLSTFPFRMSMIMAVPAAATGKR